MAPVIEQFSRAEREETRCVVAVPCQHGKTTLVQHAIVWALLRNPALKIAYVTYNDRRAVKIAKEIRILAEQCGIQIVEDFNTIADWKTPQGGGVFSTSVSGGLTGETVDWLIVDDYYAGREDAESQIVRDKVEDWYRAVGNTRMAPGGSIFIVASRWHQEDLSAYVLGNEDDFVNVTLKAINDNGEALCPWGPNPKQPRTLEWLRKVEKRVGPYEWASLYQGEPKPPSGNMFGDPTFAETPNFGRKTIGLDLAYKVGARADWSVAVVLLWTSPTSAHVLDVIRWQCEARHLPAKLRAILAKHPGVTPMSYVSGPERGVYNTVLASGIRVELRQAKVSKNLRAQPAAAAWESGRLTVPFQAEWLSEFLKEHKLFTGDDSTKEHDDQVDASVAAWDKGERATASTGKRKYDYGQRRRCA